MEKSNEQKSRLETLREQGKEAGIAGAATMTTKQLERALSTGAKESTAPVEPAAPAPKADLPPSRSSVRKATLERELDAFIAEHADRVSDLDCSTVEGRATAKRRLAAHKAVNTMRQNGTLPAASAKAPVDPVLSARAKQAWETRRADIAAHQAAQEAAAGE
jgi:hypothetical protein